MATDTDQPLRIIPLGGVGEIGKNMYVFEYGDDIVVIDCGLMFPDEEMFGIDLVVPDITYLKERRDNVKAFLITHAHEDHVGGLPYILPEFPGVPIYASTLARGLLGNKIKEHKLHNNPLLRAGAGRRAPDRAVHGHAVPGRPLDPRRDGHRPAHAGRRRRPHRRLQVRPHAGRRQADRLPRSSPSLGAEGVICLLSDSTRAENPGYTPSERTVGEAFREIMEPLDGRVIVATFASNIARLQQVLDAAADVRPQGRGHRPVDGAELPDRDGPRLPEVRRRAGSSPRTAINDDPRRQARHRHDRRAGRADVGPGADGQPRPPLRRDPARRHGHRQRQPDPGQRGIRRAHDRQPVQGRRERLLPHDQARPRLGPRQPGRAEADARPDQAASTSSRSTASSGCRSSTAGWRSRPASLPENVFIIENGTPIEISADGSARRGSPVPAGYVFVDGLSVGEVGDDRAARPAGARERRHVHGRRHRRQADRQRRRPAGDHHPRLRPAQREGPDHRRGDRAGHRVDREPGRPHQRDRAAEGQIKDGVSRYLYEQTKRRPMVFPVVVEV